MNTYTKILLTTLPMVIFSLFAIVGTAYYFTRTALVDLGETWLDTRLSEAMVIVTSQEEMLHEYKLATIPASIAKAKMDAAAEIANIGVGKLGYIFGVDKNGVIVFHPDQYMGGTDVSGAIWFTSLRDGTERLVMDMGQEPSLARFAFFQPWEWYVLAVDPMQEIYGVANRMRPYLYTMGAIAAFMISLALMLLTRRLTRPLQNLVRGTEEIGRGNLDTRIPVRSDDEFGHLAAEFNQMAFRLKETLTALQYSEEHFRALIENAGDLIWILDTRGHFRYVSPSTRRILGYEPESLLETDSFDFIHPDDQSGVKTRFQKRIQGTLPLPEKPVEQRFRHKDNHYCTLESVSNNLLNHPAIQGIVINARNITQRKKAEQALQRSHRDLETRVKERTEHLTLLNQALHNEILVRKQKERELKKANQAKSEFLANVSHEIRTPLNSVLGFSEILFSMAKDDEQKSYIQAITMAGRNLLAVLTNILDLSKIEAGKLTIQKTAVSLDTLFHEIHHLFKITLAKKKLQFQIQMDENMPDYLMLDDLRLRQVLTNLVENAVKFTEAGYIRLSARIDTGQSPGTSNVVIQVRDSGMGITKDKHQLVFESFEQEHADINRKYGGTGLGLAITKQLVELMQGQITLDSKPGFGSTFEIILPDVAISPAPTNKQTPCGVSPPDTSGAALLPDLSKSVFCRARDRYPDFLPLVKTKILPHLPGIQQGVKISDARSIAQNIMDMGRQFDLDEFKIFGQDLLRHADVFDVEKIALCLDQVFVILQEMDID
jgi:PAS domain S-box-containing protein